jgi:hypothetical protein
LQHAQEISLTTKLKITLTNSQISKPNSVEEVKLLSKEPKNIIKKKDI